MAEPSALPLKVRIRAALFLPAMGAAIFINAGTLDYWQGWVYLAASALLLVLTILQLKDRGELVKERLKPGPGVKRWDKLFMALYVPLSLAVPLLAPVDAVRYHWSPPVPALLCILGLLLYVGSYLLVTWAMRVNDFFSSAVRIQTDRGQRVVDQGPYSVVRHPGYVGAMGMFPGTALLLGSWWALVPAAVIALLIVGRTALEDAMLRRELEGYADYAQRVRFRLLPGVW